MRAGEAAIRRQPAYRAVVRGWPENALLACSGGVDSSALLVLAGLALERQAIAPFNCVHVDHQTRQGSDAEGDVVDALAARFGVLTVRAAVDPSDVAGRASSPEERLRLLRYTALARVARGYGSTSVVTAHTWDDQVETILMRLLSGTGGLASTGMAARQRMATPAGPIDVYRPLLEVSRDELVSVLHHAEVTPVTDPTNVDRAYRRNAVRHDIIPLLRETYAGFDAALARSVMLASRDAVALDSIASELIASSASTTESATRVEREVLRSTQPALATRVIRWAAARLMPENHRELSFERIESVRLASSGRTGATIELPYGVVARIERDAVVFERRNR